MSDELFARLGIEDVLTLSLNNATGGTVLNQTVAINTPTTTGIETFNIVSTGFANTLKALTLNASGDASRTLNVSGDTSLWRKQ